MAVIESSGNGYALYNGVKLPNIDSVWDKETYPYAVITAHDLTQYGYDAQFYSVWFSSTPAYYNVSQDGVWVTGPCSMVPYSCIPEQQDYETMVGLGMDLGAYGEWVSDGASDLPTADNHVVVSSGLGCVGLAWSNTNILNNQDGTTYFAASDPIPLDGMNVIEWDGDTEGLVRSSGGTHYKMSDVVLTASDFVGSVIAVDNEAIIIPAEYVTAGEDYVRLATYVFSCSKEGIYFDGNTFPEKGLYFINAFDTHLPFFAYPVSSDDDEETAVVTETSGDGFALYNGVKAPSLPNYDKTKYPYAVLDGTTDTKVLLLSSVPIVYKVGYATNSAAYYSRTFACVDGVWTGGEESELLEANSATLLTPIWSNHDIAKDDGTVYLTASKPIRLDGYMVIEWNGVKNGLDWSNDNYAEIAPHAPAVNAVAVLNKGGVLTVSTDFSVNEYSVWGVLDSDGAVIVGPVNPTDNIRVYGGSDGYVSLLAYTDTVSDLKPVYLRINGAWVKQTAYERQNGEWVLISTAEKTEETATMLYNGVELPNINTVWTDKETYPYAGIIAVEDGVVYNLYLIDSESYIGADGYIGLGAGKFAFYGCITDEELAESEGLNAGEWVYSTDGSSDSEWSIDPSVPFWSNHNILNTDGSIYLLATDPVPVT